MAVRPQRWKQVWPLDQADLRNYNVMTQHQHAGAMHKNLLITAARKTVIFPINLLSRQNGARGIINNWKKPQRMCLNQQPHSPFIPSVVAVIFPLVRSNRLNPMVNINVRGIYNLMRFALIPFTGPWQIKQEPFPASPITSILKSLRHFPVTDTGTNKQHSLNWENFWNLPKRDFKIW